MSGEVRGLSVNQPYATLMALGVKAFETRPMALPSTITPDVDVLLCSTVKRPRRHWDPTNGPEPTGPSWMLHPALERFTDWWESSDGEWGCTEWQRRWLGAVVAVVRFSESLPIEVCTGYRAHVCRSGDDLLRHTPLDRPDADGETEHVITDQLPYGDFTPGRWAWRVADVRPLTEPVSVIGDGVHHQGFWRPSAATVTAVREQVGE